MTASDLELTADERALARRVHEVGRDTLLPIAHAWGERHEMCRDLIRAMADNDLFGLNIPAGYGGRGGDHRYSVLLCLIRETLGHLDPVVDFHFGLQGLGTAAIVRQGNDAQRAEYLPSLVAGEKIFAFVLTEPHSGSDVLGMRTRARRDGDGWVIDGSKTFISGVPDADVHVVLARTGEAERGKDITAFIVPRDTPGMTGRQDLTLGAPHAIGTLEFDGCRVPDSAVIGEVNQGLAVAFGTLEVYRPSVGALAVGMGRRAMDLARDVVVGREAFERRLVDFEAVRAILARRHVDLAGSRRLVYRAAANRDAGLDTTREAAMAKLRATEVAIGAVYDAQQLHGGRGVLVGSEVEALARHARQATIYEGTSEIQRGIIARSEFRRVRDGDPMAPTSGPGQAAVAALRGAFDDLVRWLADQDVHRHQTVQYRLADAAVAVAIAERLDDEVATAADVPLAEAVAGVALVDAVDGVAAVRRELDRRVGVPAGLAIGPDVQRSVDDLLLTVADTLLVEDAAHA